MTNAFKLNRILKLIENVGGGSFDQLMIFDLACGEGSYGIAAAERGAKVFAIDVRSERMSVGCLRAKELGIPGISFYQDDIREIDEEKYGRADIVLLLGILYHLEAPDLLSVLRNVRGFCRRAIIVDTHISLSTETQIWLEGKTYEGKNYQEHGRNDSADEKRARLSNSIDNAFSFWPTRSSLFRLLKEAGFGTVLECQLPEEPEKPKDRITLLAFPD